MIRPQSITIACRGIVTILSFLLPEFYSDVAMWIVKRYVTSKVRLMLADTKGMK